MLKYLRRVASRATLLVSSGNHDLNARDAARREGRALDDARAPARRRRRRRRGRDRRHALHGLPVVGRSARRGSRSTRSSRATPSARSSAWMLGLPRAAERLADELERHASLRRRRAAWRGSVATGPRWSSRATSTSRRFATAARGSTASDDTWIFNAGPSDRPGADARDRRHATRGRAMWFSLAGNEIVRLDVAAHAAARRDRTRRGVRPAQQSFGSGSRSEPGSWSSSCEWVKRVQHLVDHAEVVGVVLELLLQVDEVGRHGVEALGEHARDAERHVGCRAQERLGGLRPRRTVRARSCGRSRCARCRAGPRSRRTPPRGR